jgi:hypothetical protein
VTEQKKFNHYKFFIFFRIKNATNAEIKDLQCCAQIVLFRFSSFHSNFSEKLQKSQISAIIKICTTSIFLKQCVVSCVIDRKYCLRRLVYVNLTRTFLFIACCEKLQNWHFRLLWRQRVKLIEFLLRAVQKYIAILCWTSLVLLYEQNSVTHVPSRITVKCQSLDKKCCFWEGITRPIRVWLKS